MPQHFMLYFKFDKDELTPESKPQYQKVFEDIKARPVYEVEVIGYTDTMGQQKYNQELSLHRADAIRDDDRRRAGPQVDNDCGARSARPAGAERRSGSGAAQSPGRNYRPIINS